MNEHPMSIEIRALEAEIERLKSIGHQKNEESFRKGIEIARLKELLTRAADALSCCNLTMQEEYDLIAELRKAAE